MITNKKYYNFRKETTGVRLTDTKLGQTLINLVKINLNLIHFLKRKTS